MSNWIRDAEAALSGGSRPSAESSVEVIEKHGPVVLDVTGGRALLAPFLAAFMWAALVLREEQVHATLEPLALGLRVLAYALTLRAVRVLAAFGQRLRLLVQRRGYGLVLADEGIFVRLPNRDVVVPRADVLGIKEESATATAPRATVRFAHVYVITHPDTGRTHVALPPIFGHSPRHLAELLMRWRGVAESTPLQATEAIGGELASKLWERAAHGETLPGVVAVKHGYGWLRGGPYASMLLGLAVLDGYVRLPAAALQMLNPRPALLLAAALVIVPAAWALITRTRLRARQGLSFVLSPDALLSRTRGGVQRTPWTTVTRVDVSSRTSWSLLRGAFDAHTLVVQRKREASVQCTEDLLALPVEVVSGLCEAYKRAASGEDANEPAT
jgi:hypothetical protein